MTSSNTEGYIQTVAFALRTLKLVWETRQLGKKYLFQKVIRAIV